MSLSVTVRLTDVFLIFFFTAVELYRPEVISYVKLQPHSQYLLVAPFMTMFCLFMGFMDHEQYQTSAAFQVFRHFTKPCVLLS